jgi:GDP-L-fucose synthase
LASKISKAVGFNGEIIWDSSKPDGTPRKVLDSSKIAKLGWKPLISLDQGIAATVEWYLQNK